MRSVLNNPVVVWASALSWASPAAASQSQIFRVVEAKAGDRSVNWLRRALLAEHAAGVPGIGDDGH